MATSRNTSYTVRPDRVDNSSVSGISTNYVEQGSIVYNEDTELLMFLKGSSFVPIRDQESGLTIQSISSSASISSTTDLAIVDTEGITVTLPLASSLGDKEFTIKNISGGSITLQPTTDTFEGETNAVLLSGDSYTIYPSTNNWILV